MSCVHFNTPNQRQQFADAASDHEPIAQWLGPQITQGRINLVKQWSVSDIVKIREAAAASHIATEAVYEALAVDTEPTVRQWLARNTSVPERILRSLVADQDEVVRCFLVTNTTATDDMINELKNDPSWKVQQLIRWRETA